MTTDFYSDPSGLTVSSDDIALEVIRRHAQRILGPDSDETPPIATPALPVAVIAGLQS